MLLHNSMFAATLGTSRALSALGRAVASLSEVDRVRSQLRHDREGGLPPARQPDDAGDGRGEVVGERAPARAVAV